MYALSTMYNVLYTLYDTNINIYIYIYIDFCQLYSVCYSCYTKLTPICDTCTKVMSTNNAAEQKRSACELCSMLSSDKPVLCAIEC